MSNVFRSRCKKTSTSCGNLSAASPSLKHATHLFHPVLQIQIQIHIQIQHKYKNTIKIQHYSIKKPINLFYPIFSNSNTNTQYKCKYTIYTDTIQSESKCKIKMSSTSVANCLGLESNTDTYTLSPLNNDIWCILHLHWIQLKSIGSSTTFKTHRMAWDQLVSKYYKYKNTNTNTNTQTQIQMVSPSKHTRGHETTWETTKWFVLKHFFLCLFKSICVTNFVFVCVFKSFCVANSVFVRFFSNLFVLSTLYL